MSPSDIAFRLSSNIISDTAADVVVQTLGYAAVPPQDVRVSGFGNSNSRTNTTPEKLSITEFDTQDVYGQQQLRTPPCSQQTLATWVHTSSRGFAICPSP